MSVRAKKLSPNKKKKTAGAGGRKTHSQSAGTPPGLPPLGLEAEVEHVVPHSWTIEAIDPSLPPVLSTPAMIGLMEHATSNAVRAALPPGTISVGTRIEVDHLKAVPDGATVHAKGRLVAYQGRFLVFEVEAWSGEHMIGRGRVFRAIVKPGLHGDKAKARVSEIPPTSSR